MIVSLLIELSLQAKSDSKVPMFVFKNTYRSVGSFNGGGAISWEIRLCFPFCGLTHQLVEEGKLMSAPFQEDKGSFSGFWHLLHFPILSLILPQFLLGNAVENFFRNEVLIGHICKFSPKRWGLITGLRGYLSSAFFTAGFKCFPYFGCAAQLAFETYLDKRGSSCWPLIPIIFEIYRLYQLSKAAHYIERLIFLMKRCSKLSRIAGEKWCNVWHGSDFSSPWCALASGHC
ncbi:hypothetical protein Patl1_09097 [Pistacia atlantica]|uniref:Uncharacterized protein n=1 Tax=Pistacia atlantica TaxID=434234 RepID=A0ACC1AF31_9ROSI|nr:hypothetical protein Patl1_09097 [Pistacia atlantica]